MSETEWEYGIRSRATGGLHREGLTEQKARDFMAEYDARIERQLARAFEIVRRPLGSWGPLPAEVVEPDPDEPAWMTVGRDVLTRFPTEDELLDLLSLTYRAYEAYHHGIRESEQQDLGEAVEPHEQRIVALLGRVPWNVAEEARK